MSSRNLTMAGALALPLIAAVLLPAGIVGCDDDRQRHNTVIVVPEGRRDDHAYDRHREVNADEHRERQQHQDRD